MPQPPHIGLLVTGAEAAADFQIFVKSLELWHPDAQLYVFTDSDTASKLPAKGKTKCTLHVKVALDAYKGMTRKIMEASPGRIYDSLFKDYTYEKAAVLEWMWEIQPSLDITGAWFMDSDITHLAPLPSVPTDAVIALCPHYIREADCKLYGKYNVGYFWIKDKSLIKTWRDAGFKSRFFEQAALETVVETCAAEKKSMYEFPIQVNFGWWRMYQSFQSPPEIQAKFTIYRPDTSVGIRYDGKPLQSIHTHWYETTSVTGAFNTWFNEYSRRFVSHKPINTLRRILNFR